MMFQPGLALVCNLISLGHLQKGLAELKARSLPRKLFLVIFPRSLFSGLSTSAEPCTAHSFGCVLTGTWHHIQTPPFTLTALTTDELQKKTQEELAGWLLTTKALSRLPEVSCQEFCIPS